MLFPSLYNFYEDKEAGFALENEKYVIENTKEMIKIGRIYNKPVVVFVWHRYHPGNSINSMKMIPKKLFLTHIKRIINTTFENQKIDGILWWGADNYSFREKSSPIFKKEFTGNEEGYKKFNDEVLSELGKCIIKK